MVGEDTDHGIIRGWLCPHQPFQKYLNQINFHPWLVSSPATKRSIEPNKFYSIF